MLVVGTRELARRARPALAIIASLVLSAGMLFAQSAERRQAPTAAPDSAPSSAQVPAPADSVADANLLAANAPAPPDASVFEMPLAAGITPEQGLQVHTVWVARAVATMFPEITTIGGARQDPLPWHPNGLAIDVMIPDHNSPEGIELGNQVAGYALANAQKWGVLHVIWRQGFYPGIGAPSWTADYGNETANHFDHVHIATDGGGYPTGHETYYLGSMQP